MPRETVGICKSAAVPPVDGDPRIPDRIMAERLASIEETQRETLAALREFTATMKEWLKCRTDERAAEAAEDAEDSRPGEAGIKAGPGGLGATR